MNNATEKSKKTVMDYVNALDSQKYEIAASCIAEDVEIIGPAGESFGKPKDFTDMLKRYHGKYSIMKMFAEGEDVCLLYDYITSGKSAYMSSWYKVRDGKIIFIRTIFDPSAFASGSKEGN